MEQVGVNFVPDSQHLSPILLMMYGKSSEFFFGVSHNHKGKFVSNVELYSSNAYMCGHIVVGMDLEIFAHVHILLSKVKIHLFF